MVGFVLDAIVMVDVVTRVIGRCRTYLDWVQKLAPRRSRASVAFLYIDLRRLCAFGFEASLVLTIDASGGHYPVQWLVSLLANAHMKFGNKTYIMELKS